jgi:hypothetical protein
MKFSALEKEGRRTMLWVLVYLIPAFQAMLPVDDADIWWHLRTGQWIIDHGQVPMADPFSTYGMGQSWIAYSWLFEILVYGLHSVCGLMGIVALTLVMSVLIAFVLHAIIRRAKLPFVLEVAILATALGSLKPLITPRPWLFSILFFAIELWVLYGVRRHGKSAHLWILPPLFALWANFHIQFVYGLAVIGFFLTDLVINRVQGSTVPDRSSEDLSFGVVLSVMILSVLAVLLTPYHYHIIQPIVVYSLESGVFSNVLEFHPLFFRSPGDWLVLLLTLGGTYILGWTRKPVIFSFLLLAMGVFLGFRARRDVWVIVLTSVAIFGAIRASTISGERFEFSELKIVVIVVGAALGTFLIGKYRQIDNANLQNVMAQRFPVGAADFVARNQLPGPLFNNFDWGGFLIWRLPSHPVSIDNRGNIHSDQRIEASLATWDGRDGWDKDQELSRAGVVIAEIYRPLVLRLRRDPRFTVVYEDSIAAVFVSTGERSH